MKRRLGITIFITMILSLFVTEVNAQSATPQNNIIVGSKFNYQVTDHGGTSTYLWTVSGDPTYTTIATNTLSNTDITWNEPGTYTITLKEILTDGVCFEERTFDVTVIGNTTTLVFGETIITGCANALPVTNTTLSLDLTLSGGVEQWTVKYKIGAVVQTDASLDNGEMLTVSHEFTNIPGGSPQTMIIEITDVYDAYGVRPNGFAFPVTKTLTLNELPNTSAILHD